MSHRTVIDASEIYLASYNKDTGAILRHGHYRLLRNTEVQTQLTGLFPPVIAVNEDGRDSQPFASSINLSDTRGGVGVRWMDVNGSPGRFHWATLDTRRQRQVTLLKKRTTRTNADAGTRVPRFGAPFQNKTFVAFDERVYSYTTSGGVEVWSANLHSFSGGGIPQSPPIVWRNLLLWFLGTNGITTFDGTTFTNIAQNAVSGVVLNDTLYIAQTDGLTRKTNIFPPVAANFVDMVRVNDVPVSMLIFRSSDGRNLPFVVGDRTLWVVDIETDTTEPAIAELPPHPYGIRAEVLSGDNQLYISQGMAVLAWDGDDARLVGLDRDDGIPTEFTGGVKRLVNGNLSLFALVDATNVVLDTSEDEAIWSGDPYRDVLSRGESYAIVFSREERGWHVRAISDLPTVDVGMMFISDADDKYRLWFSWGGVPYTIDLEVGFPNPLEDPEGHFEGTGEIFYPITDAGYYDSDKTALYVSCRTSRCSVNETVKLYVQYDDSGTWYELRNVDGSFGITTNGRHVFALHASPIPISTSPLQYGDEPSTGRQHELVQIKAVLSRGSDDSLTPSLDRVSIGTLKNTQPLQGWTLNIDMSKDFKGKTPQEQFDTLEALVHDNGKNLLFFAFNNRAGDFPTDDVFAVKITGFQARATTGETHSLKATARISLTEVWDDDAIT